MAYCLNSDIASEFKNITFNASTSVTDTEVDELIAQSDEIIDGYLTNKYTVPITGVKALKVVKRISIGLTVQRLIPILRVKTGVDKLDQDTQSISTNAERLLKDIISGSLDLSDAEKASTGQGFKSYANDNSLEHKFQRGIDQW